MTLPTRIISALLLLLTGISLSRCSMSTPSSGAMEGRIIYDVTFPYEENSVMMDLFPKEMTFHFKGSRMHSEVRSSYDLLTTDFIIDNESRTITQLLKNMSSRYAMELDADGTVQWLKQYPPVSIEPTTETSTIAGYVCSKSIAHFAGDSIPDIELYHTKGIGLDPANWWNQFNGVDGFLLGYDIVQYGKHMRMRAREVRFEAVSDDEFKIPDTFKSVSRAEMNNELIAVVEEFMQ